ncbi:EmrB/QacA subfamily drug resistance transporter [Microbacterium endophyticum]|uniref:EmrB/QacA subfamily drug resistance transporter n=1 Tax=Microbacterium endophyticum TaxID=1526412 RepID=A0A7W4V2U4_9MICO|nr:DHA2 family efflux MFS transporter permease subunit [Microbacterium endophyticum]MBB2975856.1 EmrB/QacA subfamily drug resistance transporter [Microbacterium endophyticum]NIK36339.1 EmrB/QacA subfamily drug resistance transporter [Microbacterium endophyticum]
MVDFERRRWAGLIFISVAVSLIIVDSTIVNVAVPSIVTDLGISSTQVQWVQEAYTLVFASLLLLFGSFADRFGRRRMLLVGIVIFAASSVFAALAPTGDLLILARLVQGIGGAMILPTTLSLINATFRGRERGIAFAIWGSTIGGMAALGPLLGGWLTTYFSWRWAFGINIPLGIIVFIGILLTIRESKEHRAGNLDFVGAGLSVALFGTLVFGLIEGRTYGWWTAKGAFEIGGFSWPFALSPVPVAFAITALSLVGFIAWGLHRRRVGKSSLIEFSLFRISSFTNGNIAALVVALGEFGIILSLPLWLQFVLGFNALNTGLILLALAVGSFFASGIAGATSGRVRPVVLVRAGIAAEIIGVVGVALVIRPDAPWGWLLPALFVYGMGVGLATAQLTGVILQDVPVELSGQGSGTQSTARQVGSALGIAILGTVLFTSTAGILSTSLDEQGLAASQRDQVVSAVVDSAGSAISGLEASGQSEATADAAKSAFSDGTRFAAYTAAGFLVVGLGATFALGRGGASSRREDNTEENASNFS